MNLLELLDRPISFHRPLVDITGSVTAALMLSQAIYWTRRTADPDGWFYKTQDEWKSETGLSRSEQEGARKALLKSGCWEERYDRLSHRMFYRVKTPELSRMLKTCIRECGEPAVADAENQQSVLNRTETTTETTPTPDSLILKSDTPKNKKRPGTVNGSKPDQQTIETFCESIGLPASDGEAMFLHFEEKNWKGINNWQMTIRKWRSFNYLPSQKRTGQQMTPAKPRYIPPAPED